MTPDLSYDLEGEREEDDICAKIKYGMSKKKIKKIEVDHLNHRGDTPVQLFTLLYGFISYL